ncbi:MAG: sel1 repeat family protein [Alphaproteobacteria bacterium]|nr:hypothetical protein [Alphaproteobacteria bacterium]NCB49530.1 sel1 repeat family protein [Alphaproteobacteria bacterium]
MKKQIISLVLLTFAFGSCAFALPKNQELFWTFDEDGKKAIIPQECAASTDAEQLLKDGLTFLTQTDGTEMGAGYCLLSAAFLGNVDAQFTVAQLYHHGALLPQNDISAYKWALLATINGNKEADTLGVSIEKKLSPEEIQIAHDSLDKLIEIMQNRSDSKLESLDKKIKNLRQKLIATEIDIEDIKYFGKTEKEAELEKKEASKTIDYSKPQEASSLSARPFRRNSMKQSAPNFNFNDVYRTEK